MVDDPGPGGRDSGHRAVPDRRAARLVGAGVVLVALAATAAFGYDRRRTDLGAGWLALADGRTVTVDSAGSPGPVSLVVSDRSATSSRPLPPVLASSTSVMAARGPGGLTMSSNGWVLIRLGRLHDTAGGQITRISPNGELLESFPLLQWRDAAVVGITERGRAVFRKDAELYELGALGAGVPVLALRELGVAKDLSNLVDVAVAPDGALAVLVGPGRPYGYQLFLRRPDGGPRWAVSMGRSQLFRPRSPAGAPQAHPVLGFAGHDVLVAGEDSLLRFRAGRLRDRVDVVPADRGRLHLAPSSVTSLRDGRWAIGRQPISTLDRSGHVRRVGSGPCLPGGSVRRSCPAMLGGHLIPRPNRVLRPAAAAALGALLVALAWAGRAGRTEAPRIRLVTTVAATALVTAWLAASLVWGDMQGSTPLVLLTAALAAIVAPGFPAPEPEPCLDVAVTGPAVRRYEPWVSDRIGGRATTGAGRRLEVIPIPTHS